MATVPTGRMERELRKQYLTWVKTLAPTDNLVQRIDQYQRDSLALMNKMGGQVASLGALADFPAPKLLDLDPVAGVVYSDMKQAAIQAGIATGLNARTTARAMLNAGMDKSYRRLERLARTETVRAYWKNTWDSAAGLGLVMVWSSEKGPRTCHYCDSRDGLVVEDPSIRDHPNGRCTLLPMLPSRVDYKGTLQSAKSNATPEINKDPSWAKPSTTKPTPARQVKSNLAQKQPDIVPPTNPRIIKSMKDMDDFAKGMPTSSQLGAKAAQVLDDYAKGSAYAVNSVLRGAKAIRGRAIDARTKAYSKKFTKDMDKMMDASIIPEDVRVVRALGADAFGGLDELQKLAGGIYKDKGYMSTSLAEKTSKGIYDVADAVDMEIIVPKGSRGVYMAGESYLRSERELLLDRGTNLAVKSVTYNERTKRWQVKATVVPGPR